MKATQIFSVGIIGLVMSIPFTVSAEESANVQAEPTTTAVPTLYDGAGSLPQPMLIRESPTRPGMNVPRDAASGLPTGKREAVTGIQPLPSKIEREVELREERMASATERVGEVKDRVEERKAEMKQRAQERRSEILKRMADKMVGRIEAAITRLSKLADRVDSRIAKLKEKGIDTSAAEGAIIIARTKLTEASTAVSEAKAEVDGAVVNADASDATTEVDAGKPVREALEKARDAVTLAHKALVDAVKALKANVKVVDVPEEGATSTESN
ncbi:MAG: hypothetical protein UY04_C0004G0020 [Parcubacteria group bacterium GW2011_GWA2_47_7]|nr:MAG: hypothetical protein UY04_C0004G0020 [Parcubacteria group bacterium GW2011_GWA2_47_7]